MTMQLAQAGMNLLVSGCLGAAIGFERQWRQRLAGLRTNALVALGAAIFVTYSRIVLDDQGAARMAAQVVSGIGFLGAGVIFKEGLNVRGLNTAATLWCSAAVGLIAGEGFALFGVLAAALVIGANTALRPIVHAINRQPIDTIEEEQHYLISITCQPAVASDVRSILVHQIADVPEIHFSEVDTAFNEDGSRVDVTAIVTSQKRRELLLEAIVAKLNEVSGVTRASWRLNRQPIDER
jgi:putative Mg2+ transporter-C (MgtC) family protein